MNRILDGARDLPNSPFADPTSSLFNAPNPTLGKGGPPPDLYPDLPPPP